MASASRGGLPTILEDKLSHLDSFVLCDTNTAGFPIRFASQGFAELFEYSALESLGKTCGELVGCQSILDHEEALAEAARLGELSREEARTCIERLRSHVAAEVQEMAANPSTKDGFSIMLNRKKGGELFVCELLMHMNQHPTLGWSYCVGLQRDISREVRPHQLLRAALHHGGAEGGLVHLLRSRRQVAEPHAELIREGNGAELLHGLAGGMWQSLVAELFQTKDKPAKRATRSIASRSTASSLRSAGSARSVKTAASAASSDPWDESWGESGNAESLAAYGLQDQAGGYHLGAIFGAGVPAAQAEAGPHSSAPAFPTLPAPAPLPSAPVPVRPEAPPLAPLLAAFAAAAIAAATAAAPEVREDMEHSAGYGRFLDLLEEVSSEQDESEDRLRATTPRTLTPQLEEAVELVDNSRLRDLSCPFALLDPSLPGCPVLLASAGFSSLSGYTAQEVVGLGYHDLLHDANSYRDGRDMQARTYIKALVGSAASGAYHPEGKSGAAFLDAEPEGAVEHVQLPSGEFACATTCRKRCGAVARYMVYLKQVELDEKMHVVWLQAQLPDLDMDPEEQDRTSTLLGMAQRCQAAFRQLSLNMDSVTQVLSAEFWYSSSMRRQIACSPDSV